MKVIAVSRDMLNVYGLKHRSKVRIKGLDGEYLVLDKMNKRWKKKIDIYMGKDLKKAFKWRAPLSRASVELS
jgi:3D (Asp-Asp-Asp) domain-containing protein